MQQFFFFNLFHRTRPLPPIPYPAPPPPPNTLPLLPLTLEFTSVVRGQYTVSAISIGILDPPLVALGNQGGGGARDVCPLSVQFLSFSCSFWQKPCQIIGFCSKIRSWHHPPPPPSGKSCIRHWVVFLTPTSGFSLVFHSSRVFSTVELVAIDYHYVGVTEGFSLSYLVWWN